MVTWMCVFATGWLAGAGLAWAFVAGANRNPSPEPVMPLDTLDDLARVA